MYAIRIGDPVADDQIGTLSAAEVDALLELYEALRLAPGNGSLHVEGGNMYTWDHRGISVTYILLEEQREVAVLRVDRFPVLAVPQGAVTARLSAMAVLRFAVFCKACKAGFHARCWDHLGDLTAPCPCGCWGEDGMLTQSALLDMMRRQPEALARHIRFTEAFARGNSLDLHLGRTWGRG